MKVNSFDVLKLMSERNLDIRGFPLIDNLVNVNNGKKRATLMMTIDPGTAHDLMVSKSLVAMLIVADGNQFSALRAELERGDVS